MREIFTRLCYLIGKLYVPIPAYVFEVVPDVPKTWVSKVVPNVRENVPGRKVSEAVPKVGQSSGKYRRSYQT